jgi:hypothetical protein
VVGGFSCDWPSCDGPAGVAVQLGARRETFRLHGRYCVPHAVITADRLRGTNPGAVWYDWIRPPRLRLVAEDEPSAQALPDEEAAG